MFDLENAIVEWRTRMLAGGIKSPVPLEELESHLREEIDRGIKSGQGGAKAFHIAAQLIGPAGAVQNEFEKVHAKGALRRWRQRQIWGRAILGVLQLIVIGAVVFNSEMTFGQRMSGLAAIGASLLLVAAVGRLSLRFFPAIHDRRRRTAVIFISCVPVIIWSLVAARFFLLGQEFPFGLWLAKVLWVSGPPLAVYLGVIWGVETAARQSPEFGMA